jgi:cytoskeletal protein RodZ
VIDRLSAELQERRRLLGLSRHEAFRKFKVPIAFIAAIEEGTFEALPAPVYARGFLKTYCEGLGIAPEPPLDILDEALRIRRRFRVPFRGDRAAARPTWLDDALTWATVVGVIVLGWFAYSAVVNPGTQSREAGVHAQTVDWRGEDPFAAP